MADSAEHTLANAKGDQTTFDEMELHEKEAFDRLMRPSDSYNIDGQYWADLPIGQRLRFVASTDAAEARSEFSWLRNMFKNDPLSPVGYYLRNAVLPGAGLGLEG